MKAAPRCPRESNGNYAYTVLFLVAILTGTSLSQESASKERAAPHVSISVVERSASEMCFESRCRSEVPDGFISIQLQNRLPGPIHATIDDRSGSVEFLFNGRIAGNDGAPPVGPITSVSAAKIRVPVGAYEVTVESAVGSMVSTEIKGQSSRVYVVTIDYSGPSASSGSPGSHSSSIRSNIDQIAGGVHQALPPPTQSPLSLGQHPGWDIENATGYQLHLYLSGAAEREYVIPNGNSISIDLPPGAYRIAARVSSGGVKPFYATWQLGANARWSYQFYIAPVRE
jgi:hypothetical protein